MTARDAAICRWTIYSGVVLFGLLLVVSFRAVVPLAAIMAGMLLWFGPRAGLFTALRRDRVVQSLGAVLLVSTALAYWSINYSQTLPKILQLSAIFGLGSALVVLVWRCADILSIRAFDIALASSIALCAAAVLVVGFFSENLKTLGVDARYFSGPASLMNRGLIILPFIAVVALMFPRRPILTSAGMFAVFFSVVTLFQFSVPAISFVVVLLAASLYGAFRLFRVGARAPILIGGFAAGLFLSSVIVINAAPTTIVDLMARGGAALTPFERVVRELNLDNRFEIWTASAERALERPLTGWGLGATRRVPDTDGAGAIGLHPHNAFLQAWLELGAFGAMVCAGLMWFCGRRLSRLCGADAHRSALAAAGFGGLVMVFGASFGAFQSWWIVSLMLIAAFAAVRIRMNGQTAAPR